MSISKMHKTQSGAIVIGKYFTDCAGDMLELERQKVIIKEMNKKFPKVDGSHRQFYIRLKGRSDGASRFDACKEYYRNKYEGISDRVIKRMAAQSMPVECSKVLVAYLDYRLSAAKCNQQSQSIFN
jgi:hypothetical protein